MYIHHKLSALLYKLLVALLCSFGAWLTFETFGLTAWRVFVTYPLIVGAIYFLVSAIMAFWNYGQQKSGFCAMLEGALIIGFLTSSITVMVCYNFDWSHPSLQGAAAALVYATLPILVTCDYFLFVPKGHWQPIYPFYWLAFPIIYASMMVLTAEDLPVNTPWLYPLEFLNYKTGNFALLVQWFVFYSVAILIVGYILYVLDALMGGKVGKYIVLPRIKLVEIEDANPARTKPKSTKAKS